MTRQPSSRRRTLSIATLALAGIAALALSLREQKAVVIASTFEDQGRSPRTATTRNETSRDELAMVARATGWYSARIGTRFTFALKGELGTELHRPAGGLREDAGTVKFAGTMQVTVLDRRFDELVTAVRFPDLRLSSPMEGDEVAKRLENLRRALEKPVLTRLDNAGRALGYRFPEGYDFFAKNHARTLLGNLRFVVPEGVGLRWTVEDRDVSGTFESGYAWASGSSAVDSSRVSRRRLRYVSMQNLERGSCQVKIDSHASATLSRSIGWLVAARVREHTVLAPKGFPVEVHNRFEAELDLTDTQTVVREPVDWDGTWSATSGDSVEAQLVAQNHEAAIWRKKLEGAPLRGLVQWFEGLLVAGEGNEEAYQDAWAHIAWKCRLDPKAIADLTAWIRAGHFDEKTAATLLTVIGDAGTPEAQATLAGLHGDSGLGVQLRAAAAVGLLQSPHPTAAAQQSVLATATGAQATEDLGKMSLLILGALAGRSSATLAKGETAFATLVSLEHQARENGTLDAWLLALGNSRSPRIIEHAARHIAGQNAKVRESAAIALRSVTSRAACDLLVARAASDLVTIVRLRAVESLSEHGTPRAKAALRRLILRESAAHVREAMVHGLAINPTPADISTLRHVASHDKSAELRRLAQQVLASV